MAPENRYRSINLGPCRGSDSLICTRPKSGRSVRLSRHTLHRLGSHTFRIWGRRWILASETADEPLRLKPTRFASSSRNIHCPNPPRCLPLRICARTNHPQDPNWKSDVEIRLRSHASATQGDAGLPLRSVPDRKSQNKPFPLHPSTARTPKTNPQHGPNRKSATKPRISPRNGHETRYQRKATNSPATPKPRNSNNPRTRRQTTTTDNPPGIPHPADQTGNRALNSESVHGTPPDKDLRLDRHHRPNIQNHGIPMIPTGHHRRTQPRCGSRRT